MIRRRVVVGGRVQGVGFRYFVREHARALGLAGWVRNLQDGEVDLEVEGAPDAVAELLKYVAEGPDGAVVSRVTEVDLRDPDAILPMPFAIER